MLVTPVSLPPWRGSDISRTAQYSSKSSELFPGFRIGHTDTEQWSGSELFWVTRSNKGQQNEWFMAAHHHASAHASFLQIAAFYDFCPCHDSGHLTLQVLSRVTSSAWQFITRSHSHPHMRMLELCWCRNCHDWSSKVPRDLLSRSSVSNLLSKLQSKILNSNAEDKEWQQISWE